MTSYTVGAMSAEQRGFHLEEFKQLKAEISTLLERVASLFKYGLIGSAAVYSWFLTNLVLKADIKQSPEVLLGASLIPPVLVFFFGLLALATYRHVDTAGRYLLKVERHLGDESLGWEKFWRQEKTVLLPMLFYFYLFLLAVEIGIVVWVYFKF